MKTSNIFFFIFFLILYNSAHPAQQKVSKPQTKEIELNDLNIRGKSRFNYAAKKVHCLVIEHASAQKTSAKKISHDDKTEMTLEGDEKNMPEIFTEFISLCRYYSPNSPMLTKTGDERSQIHLTLENKRFLCIVTKFHKKS